MSIKNGLRLKIPFLRFVIYKGEQHYVARCLEHDFAVQILDPDCAEQEISGMISAQVKVALDNDVKPFANMGPAPAKFHKMWDDVTNKKPEVSCTMTQEHDSREYVSQLAYA